MTLDINSLQINLSPPKTTHYGNGCIQPKKEFYLEFIAQRRRDAASILLWELPTED